MNKVKTILCKMSNPVSISKIAFSRKLEATFEKGKKFKNQNSFST